MTGMTRVQAGVPSGGQFAAGARAEAGVTLHDSLTSYGDSDGPSHDLSIDDAYLAGLRDGVATRQAPQSETRPVVDVTGPERHLAAAKRLHMRHCSACHGADQSCIQIEEQFLPQVREVLDADLMATA